ncbi:MAG: hypothetical protein ACLRX5_07355 [Slackia sp.]
MEEWLFLASFASSGISVWVASSPAFVAACVAPALSSSTCAFFGLASGLFFCGHAAMVMVVHDEGFAHQFDFLVV